MFNYLIPITLVSLFLPYKDKIGPVQVRPFDALVVLLALLTVPHLGRVLRFRVAKGFPVLLPFFLILVLSAFSYTLASGLRELLQAVLLLTFAFLLSFYADKVDYRKIGLVLMIGLFAVMAYNIGWHIQHGFWSGWKRLLDPKAAFIFLPMLLAVYLIFGRADRRRLYWALWGLVGLAILLSGERKALLVYGLLSVVLVSRGRLLAAAPVSGAAVLGLLFFASATDDPYVSRQIRTVLQPTSTQLSLGALVSGETPASLSNASREFQLAESRKIISESPLFGVGTNAYKDRVKMRFGSLPEYLLAGLHGEFLRALVENGILGLIAYCGIWVSAIVRLRRMLGSLRRRGYLEAVHSRMLAVVLILPPLFYVAFEASGTRVMMATVIVSLMPLFVLRGVTARRARVAPERAAADDRGLSTFSDLAR